jgi:hypothetical protein
MCRIAMPILQASFVVLGLPLEAVRIYNVDYETSVIFFYRCQLLWVEYRTHQIPMRCHTATLSPSPSTPLPCSSTFFPMGSSAL